jgi:amino acid transporter
MSTPSEQGTGGRTAKRLLVGRAMASSKMEHTLLPKFIALPVFSSDPLSSNAYATEEILAVLLVASAGSAHLVMPIAIPIAILLAIVVTSYRQTVRAYPSGGGAYIVSKENLGVLPGLIAASALLVDYVLTVAVSVTAGVVAISSAFPAAREHAVVLALTFVLLLTLANLRGVKEAGTFFAVPTYAFVTAIFVMLVVGLAKCTTGCPVAEGIEPAHELAKTAAPLSLFVILHAFSSGSTALTGVEAISNGVPAFRRPQAHNAARTLGVMGIMTIGMFLGISYLATHISGITVSEQRSVVGQVAYAVFNGGFGFYAVQAFTAAILILAANTAYQDFPRLSSILAQDGYMPSQFKNRGDRLVFSNGVIVLASLAAFLIYLFEANLGRLIQLYVVGVFTSFTLSQAGMVRHWLREKDRNPEAASGWRRSIVINAVGATVTGLVLIIITSTKFMHGAWIVVCAVPVIVVALYSIHRHYAHVAAALRIDGSMEVAAPATNRHLFLVSGIDAATTEALAYLRALRPSDVTPLYIGSPGDAATTREHWQRVAPNYGGFVDLSASGERPTAAIRRFLREHPGPERGFTTIVVPETVTGGSLRLLNRRQRRALVLKARLLFTPDVVVTDVPLVPAEAAVAEERTGRPFAVRRSITLIPVAAVNEVTIRAVRYAGTLDAARTQAIYLATDPDDVPRIAAAWSDHEMNVPLSIVEAPFRDFGPPLLEEVRRYTKQADTIVTVVIPEFVVTTWWEHLLHGQTALFIKRKLLIEPQVVVTSVPFRLPPRKQTPTGELNR